MKPHRTEKNLERDGTLMIEGLPFHAGDTVEIIIFPKATTPQRTAYALRGTLVKYANPFEPVAAGDWEAAK